MLRTLLAALRADMYIFSFFIYVFLFNEFTCYIIHLLTTENIECTINE